MELTHSDVAYPELDGITPDANSVRILAPAYASECGELNAILQYVYQHMQLKSQKLDTYAETVEIIFIQEMKHLEILGELMIKLGVSPVYVAYPPYPANFYASRSVCYSSEPQKIFIDDIAAEQGAIESYNSMLRRLTNERVAAVVKRIVMDEEVHLSEFKRMLKEINVRYAN